MDDKENPGFERVDFNDWHIRPDLTPFMKAGLEGVVISLFINQYYVSSMSIEVTFN